MRPFGCLIRLALIAGTIKVTKAHYLPAGDFTKRWLPDSVKRGRIKRFSHGKKPYGNGGPIALLPPRTNPRIVAQQGMFTVHGASEKPLEEQIKKWPKKTQRITKIEISRDAILQLWLDLQMCGINQMVLFPELDKVADQIVLTRL
ncbi:MAG: hypothetical protein GY822_23435 [Deltaproteobacteria bacterium]|nr:hypothetical protein [Deltaproteobacteria bacterium]